MREQKQFPQIDRASALRQLELLGYKPEDKVYLRFFYPSDDPRKDEDRGRKADQLNWEQIERYQQQGRGVYFVGERRKKVASTQPSRDKLLRGKSGLVRSECFY